MRILANYLVICFLFSSSVAFSQEKDREGEFTPKWVTMMNDPKSNYYETIEEFRKFWEGKALPEEPFENKEMDVFEREVGLIHDSKDHKEREQIERKARAAQGDSKTQQRSYAAEVRAFKGWLQHVKPWVLENGSIVTLEEQQQIIDKQQLELNQTESQQKR
jgi:hypothetical protein